MHPNQRFSDKFNNKMDLKKTETNRMQIYDNSNQFQWDK